jgi:hypothetical protein
MSAIEIVTKEDLTNFKQELLEELKTFISKNANPEPKRWLKTYEVKKMLGISSGTLQTMRNNGILSYSLIGGLAFYNYEEILALMEKNKKPALIRKRT